MHLNDRWLWARVRCCGAKVHRFDRRRAASSGRWGVPGGDLGRAVCRGIHIRLPEFAVSSGQKAYAPPGVVTTLIGQMLYRMRSEIR